MNSSVILIVKLSSVKAEMTFFDLGEDILDGGVSMMDNLRCFLSLGLFEKNNIAVSEIICERRTETGVIGKWMAVWWTLSRLLLL